MYDASLKAKKGDNSLNDCLYCGPILLPDLSGILLCFRQYPIVMLTDIEKAFFQVGIQEKDRDVTRFLWFKDPNNVERYIDSVTSDCMQSYLLLAGTSLVSYIRENIYYVDIITLGAISEKEAFEIYIECKRIFQGG